MFVTEIVHICATNHLFYVDLVTIEYSNTLILTLINYISFQITYNRIIPGINSCLLLALIQ
jgi:hypothetical protein